MLWHQEHRTSTSRAVPAHRLHITCTSPAHHVRCLHITCTSGAVPGWAAQAAHVQAAATRSLVGCPLHTRWVAPAHVCCCATDLLRCAAVQPTSCGALLCNRPPVVRHARMQVQGAARHAVMPSIHQGLLCAHATAHQGVLYVHTTCGPRKQTDDWRGKRQLVISKPQKPRLAMCELRHHIGGCPPPLWVASSTRRPKQGAWQFS